MEKAGTVLHVDAVSVSDELDNGETLKRDCADLAPASVAHVVVLHWRQGGDVRADVGVGTMWLFATDSTVTQQVLLWFSETEAADLGSVSESGFWHVLSVPKWVILG